MKKIALALLAAATISAPAFAADMAARPYAKAPPAPVPVYSWTGCYIGAGGGGALTNNDHRTVDSLTGLPSGPFIDASPNETGGARGWFGTVQAGCDYQFNNFVVGVFGDYDFMSVKGDIGVFGTNGPREVGSQKQDWQWAVGGRVGYLIFPQLLTYVSGGYTQGHWKNTNLAQFGGPQDLTLLGGTRGGWFIGTGDEYALSFLPGLFWKTEYRYSEFDSKNSAINGLLPFNPPIYSGSSEHERVKEHSVRSELVWRFNWR